MDLNDREALNERLHSFAHDLKNKLGSLWEVSRLLKDVPDGPDRDELLALSERSYFNGARELEALLDDLEVPRGITRSNAEMVEFEPILLRCVQNIDHRLEKKGQSVIILGKGPITLFADKQLLEEMVEALLSNASKFSPPGASIRASFHCEDGKLIIQVDDEGVGLDQNDLQSVFTRYALLSSRSTSGESQARSTLSRIRHTIRLHQGKIEASSEGLGKGSRFTITLPLRKVQALE